MTIPRTRQAPRGLGRGPVWQAQQALIRGVGYSVGLALLSAENHRKGLGWTLVWEMNMRMVPRKDCGKLSVRNCIIRDATHLSFRLPEVFWKRKQ